MIGGATGVPVANSTGPGMPTPMPRTSARLCALSLSSASKVSSSQPRTVSGPSAIGMSVRVSTMTSPARSVTATRECVAPRSAASTTPALRLKAKVFGGRPPVEALAPAGTTSRCASRASIRWATVERASPVSATSSARVLARPSRMSRSMAPAPVPVDDPLPPAPELLLGRAASKRRFAS